MAPSRLDRVYRALLRLYPREFREEFGPEMVQLVRDEAGGTSAPAVWLDVARDLLRTAPREHLTALMSDLRYACRAMRKAPGFAAAVIATVGLGVGANTAIFSLVNAVIVRPLPFADPGRLVQVAEKNDTLHVSNFGASVLNYLSWKEQTQSFEELGAVGQGSFNLSGTGDPEQLTGARISPSVTRILGVRPILGRSFADVEERPGSPPVALISEGLWKRRFGADPTAIGRTMVLNGLDHTLVGVMPPNLAVLTSGDVWTPLTIDPGREIRLNHVIFVIGRLRPAVSLRQAQVEMNTVAARVGRQFPEVKDWGINLIDFHRTFVSPQLETGLLVLFGAVTCVLLIACANVANLLLARAAARQREIAVRTAMGASRGRLVRQLLVESVAMSAAGGVVGLALGVWAIRVINVTLPAGFLPVPDVPLDVTVLVFAFVMTLATGVMFGLAPAWQASKTDVNAMLKQSSRTAADGGRPMLRNGLAAAELGLATVLLIGAGLLAQSLLKLQRVDLGFNPAGLLTFQLSLPPAKYPGDKASLFHRQLLEALGTIPGVDGAAVSSGIPFGVGNYTTTPMFPKGPSALPSGTSLPIDWRIVSPDFFRVMRIPVTRGRGLSDADGPSATNVAVISQAVAQRFWGTEDPIGRSFHSGARDYTVVGVVSDVRNTALNADSPTVYFPSAARVWPLMDVVVRTPLRPEALLPAVRQKIRALDGEMPIANSRTVENWVANGASQPRLNAALLAVFAAVAMAIAAVGVYGVLAYSVTQRTREIGLRLALGAPRWGVLRLIVREGMTVAATGLTAGLVSAFALSRALTGLVFQVEVHDPATFGTVAILLLFVALAACFLPARRASNVDPMVALRQE